MIGEEAGECEGEGESPAIGEMFAARIAGASCGKLSIGWMWMVTGPWESVSCFAWFREQWEFLCRVRNPKR